MHCHCLCVFGVGVYVCEVYVITYVNVYHVYHMVTSVNTRRSCGVHSNRHYILIDIHINKPQ